MTVHADVRPRSFTFTILRSRPDGGDPVFWCNGGLIFFGPNDGGAGFPTLSVEVAPQERPHWSIHS